MRINFNLGDAFEHQIAYENKGYEEFDVDNENFKNICLRTRKIRDALLPYFIEGYIVSNCFAFINVDKVKKSHQLSNVILKDVKCLCGATHHVWVWTEK